MEFLAELEEGSSSLKYVQSIHLWCNEQDV